MLKEVTTLSSSSIEVIAIRAGINCEDHPSESMRLEARVVRFNQRRKD